MFNTLLSNNAGELTNKQHCNKWRKQLNIIREACRATMSLCKFSSVIAVTTRETFLNNSAHLHIVCIRLYADEIHVRSRYL